MSSSAALVSPHGQGRRHGARLGPAGSQRATPGLDEPRQILFNWRLFPFQRQVLAADLGIDFVIAGIGGGKSWVAALKCAMWAIRHPRGPDKKPTQGLVMGQDFKLVRKVQLELILEHLRHVCYLGAPEEWELELGEDPRPGSPIFVWRDGSLRLEPPPHVAIERTTTAGYLDAVVGPGRALVRPLVPIPYEALVANVVGGQDPRIELWNGVQILGFSGRTPDRVRGHAFEWAWLDEAEWMTVDAFSMAMARQRAAESVRVILTSSPATVDPNRPDREVQGDGFAWRVISGEDPSWDSLREANPVRVHRWKTEANPTLSRATVKTIRAGIEATRPGQARAELDGLFIGTTEAPAAGPIDATKAFVGRIELPVGGDVAAVVAVDLARSRDFCFFTAAAFDDGVGTVLATDRFNESEVYLETPEDYWPHVYGRLVDFVTRWGAGLVVVDTAKGGDMFANEIRVRLGGRVKVVEVRTEGKGNRPALIEAVGMAINLGKLRVPSAWKTPKSEGTVQHVEVIRAEFKKLQSTSRPNGSRVFSAPERGHDDGVLSLALAWHGLSMLPRGARRNLGAWKSPSAPPARPGGAAPGRWGGGPSPFRLPQGASPFRPPPGSRPWGR